jgi:hypothetical protein
VTGKPPFADTPGVGAMIRKLTEYMPDLVDINPHVSDNFAWLVEKMLARNKKMRQRSWHAVLDDIDEVIHKRLPLSVPVRAGMSTMMRSKRRTKSGIRQIVSKLTHLARPESLAARWRQFWR